KWLHLTVGLPSARRNRKLAAAITTEPPKGERPYIGLPRTAQISCTPVCDAAPINPPVLEENRYAEKDLSRACRHRFAGSGCSSPDAGHGQLRSLRREPRRNRLPGQLRCHQRAACRAIALRNALRSVIGTFSMTTNRTTWRSSAFPLDQIHPRKQGAIDATSCHASGTRTNQDEGKMTDKFATEAGAGPGWFSPLRYRERPTFLPDQRH